MLVDRMSIRLGNYPFGNQRPMLLQRVRSHEQANMAPRHGFLNDAVLPRSEQLGGIKNLLGCRNVIRCTNQQIGRTFEIAQIELSA